MYFKIFVIFNLQRQTLVICCLINNAVTKSQSIYIKSNKILNQEETSSRGNLAEAIWFPMHYQSYHALSNKKGGREKMMAEHMRRLGEHLNHQQSEKI